MVSSRSEIKKAGYSPNEIRLLGLLPKGGRPITSAELIPLMWPVPPIHARQSIVAAMSTLIRKVELNREPYAITKTVPSGPIPIEYRKVNRK